MSIKLYPFQQATVDKLGRQKAGLIADEMGCGKTHTAIALDQLWWGQLEVKRPTLIVAPLNTFTSWKEKYKAQAPFCDVVLLNRKQRDLFVRKIKQNQGDVFVMHWEALRLIEPQLEGYQFGTVIADEVHRASNRKAQATYHLKKIKTQRKLGLSGTASGDKPQNLWSILNWLWPTFYTSYWKFVDKHCTIETQQGINTYRQIIGIKNITALHAQMEPWYVRHLKREQCCSDHPNGVMHWLPEKTYETIWVDLNPVQRRIYNQMKQEMVAWVNEHEDTPLVASVVVAQMTRLSQIALATPKLTTTVSQKWDKGLREYFEDERLQVTLIDPSSKIDAVKELIQDHDGKRFVVFTSSKQAAYLAARNFNQSSIPSRVLSGDTIDRERHQMVADFIRGDFQVFIAVIQAAAEGIDGLQHATDTAIFLDRSWSTIKNKQAEDRLHRGGQKNTVTIIDVMARDTLDFGRAQHLNAKWAWIKAILGDNNAQQKVLRGMI